MLTVNLVARTIFTILGLLVVSLAFLWLAHMVLSILAGVIGISWDFANTMLCLIALKFFLPSKWQVIPIRFSLRGRALISASPSEVWARIYPRPDGSYYLSTVDRIEVPHDRPNGVDLYFDDRLKAVASEAPMVLKATISEPVIGHHVHLKYLNNDEFPLFSTQVDSSDYRIEQKGEMTELQISENLSGLSFTGLISFLFLNPSKDAVQRVKAMCEGQQDTSVMGALWAQTEGEGTDQAFDQVAKVVKVTAMGFVSMLGLAVFWGVLQLIQPG